VNAVIVLSLSFFPYINVGVIDSFLEGSLKELIGHTPLEVLAGAVHGVTVAFVMS